MARIRQPATPSLALAFRWVPRPRLAFALATAMAGVVAFVVVSNRQPARLVQRVQQTWQVLDELGQVQDLPAGEWEHELQTLDGMVLAEAEGTVEDEVWIEQSLSLLGELEQDPAAVPDESDEEWMQELELLDNLELASS